MTKKQLQERVAQMEAGIKAAIEHDQFQEMAKFCNKTMKKIITSNVGCGDYKHNCVHFNEIAFKEAIKKKFSLEI